jgi:hypothetical protein
VNWEEVSAIGQVLGSLAVFVTLGYLAVQVRHARTDLQRSISQGRSEAIRSLLLTRATDERLARIIAKADAAYGSEPQPFVAELVKRGLTIDEALAVQNEQGAFWNYRLQVIPYIAELPNGDRLAFDSAIRRAYGSPGVGRFYYEAFAKAGSLSDATRYIDNLLAQPG